MIKILCYGGNKQVRRIVLDYQDWKYGIRQDTTSTIPVYFLDNHFLKPNKAQYMKKVATYKPYVATLPDLVDADTYNQYLDYYKDTKDMVGELISIPKTEEFELLTDYIGYSIPSRYAKSPLPVSYYKQFKRIHLLGGNPKKQYDLCNKLGNVISFDQNMICKAAYFGNFFNYKTGKWDTRYSKNKGNGEGNFEFCLRKSIENISLMFS
jgi:hypothetical protein